MRCECSDPGCPVHRRKETCSNRARQTLYRVDMHDETGTAMCDPCADDAFASGVFTTADDDDEQAIELDCFMRDTDDIEREIAQHNTHDRTRT